MINTIQNDGLITISKMYLTPKNKRISACLAIFAMMLALFLPTIVQTIDALSNHQSHTIYQQVCTIKDSAIIPIEFPNKSKSDTSAKHMAHCVLCCCNTQIAVLPNHSPNNSVAHAHPHTKGSTCYTNPHIKPHYQLAFRSQSPPA